jgi:predicted extracellular nuclease
MAKTRNFRTARINEDQADLSGRLRADDLSLSGHRGEIPAKAAGTTGPQAARAPGGGPQHLPGNVVINEFAVASTTSAADEYIEIKNISAAPVDINGWRLVYRSAAGVTDVAIINWTTSTIIPAGGYLLIANTTGYSGTKIPDFTWTSGGTGTFSGTSGGLALRNGPANTGTIIDSVGYGAATNAFVEGTAEPVHASNQALHRSQDTDNNSADFSSAARDPQSSVDNPAVQTVVFDPASVTVTQAEGDAGATVYTFTVTRTGGTTGQLDFSGTIAAGTTDAADYTGAVLPTVFSGSIPAGQASAMVTVSVNGDVTIEGNESFQLTLTSVTNASATATIGAAATATGNITNDDIAPAPGSLSIADFSQSEGNSGSTAFSFIVSRTGGDDGAVSATWTINRPGGVGGAQDDDFATGHLFTGTVAFADGETSKTIIVNVNGDTTFEDDEAFTVTLSAPMGGVAIGDDTGAGLIQNDDAAPVPVVSIADASIIEGESGTSILQLTVTRSGPTSAFTVDFATSNGGNPNNASATAGSDYVAQSGTLSFAIGQTTATIDIVINGDDVDELSEEFTVTLSNATGGATLGDATAIGTITSDDTGPAGPTGVWINEFHYDNSGADAGEFIEIAAQAGTNLAGYSLVLYNGSGGASYQTIDLSGTIPNQAGGYGTLQFAAVGLQNGAPDGIALVGPGGVIEFISYEGTMTAGNGPAVGLTSTDVGVSEPGTASGTSIGRTGGPGSAWVLFSDDSPGQLNIGQLLGPTPTIAVSDVSVNEAAGTMTFTVTRTNVAPVAFTVDYATANGTATAGSDYGAASGTLSFTANQLQALVTVTISDNAVPEFDETLFFNLSNATNGAVISDNQAVGTIVNDDGTPITVSIGDVIQAEGTSGTTIFTFNVVRSGGTGAFDINFDTANGSATVAGNDYLANSGVLNFGVGENFKTISVTVNGDMTPEPVENFFVNLSNATNNVIVTDASGTGTILDGAGTLSFIHDIQGTAYFSPILAGEGITSFNQASAAFVTVQAIITAIDNDGNRQGFYIQEQITDWDGNNFTSEGIFVMTRNDAGVGTVVSGVAVGDLVTVSAQVMEYQGFSTNMPITALVNPSAIVVNSAGNSAPAMVLTNMPNEVMTLVTPDYTDSSDGAGDTFDASLYALSYFETVEGMLVTIPNMVVADGFVSLSVGDPYLQAYSLDSANADQINSRGGYTIAGDPPIGPPDTATTGDDTIQGGRHLHDGDVNPDIIELDFTGWAMPAPSGLTENATMGDLLGDVTGIISFDFTDRKLFVTAMEPGGFVNGGMPVQEVTLLGDDSRALTVATFNVENLDPTDGAARFTALANAIANNLNAPDIICIEEMQDNNGASASGGADASTTWQMMVNALNLATGANYQWVDQEPVAGAEGGEPGGNIRVGFLYNTDRVQLGDLAANATLAERRMYTDRIGDGVRDAGDLIAFSDNMLGGEINTSDWTTTRKSLLGEFTFHGNTVYVTANHWPAKGGSGDFWQFNQNIGTGDPDNSDWAQRSQVGQDVYSMMNLIQSTDADAGIVAGGDFNDFYFYRPLTTVTGYTMADGTARVGGALFDNLTLTLSEAERYTYTFDGRSQAIDHIIANNLLSGVATYDIVHLNTGYNSRGTGANANPALSDHDPGVSSYDYRSFSETLAGTSGNDMIEGFGGDDTISGLAGSDILAGNAGTDTLLGGTDNDTYLIEDANDTIVELAGEGNRDIIYTAINYTLANSVFVEVLAAGSAAGTDPLVLIGNDKANEVYGNAGNNLLHGGGGADLLVGLGGNDVYYTDVAATQVVEIAGGGTDALYTSVSYTLGGNAVVELLSSNDYAGTGALALTGNGFNQVVAGNAGANVLHGGGGTDILYGFGGNDIFYTDVAATQIVEGAGGGTDTLYTSVSYVLGGNAQVELLSTNSHASTAAINLTGNGFDNQLFGNAGTNILHGGGGVDILVGFGGNDTYYIDVAATRVFEDVGGGTDAVYASLSYTLGASQEIEILSTNSHAATSAINLTGNSFANSLFGNAGDNVLDGKGGNDQLIGFAGADTFQFSTTLGAGNVDSVHGFTHDTDKIALDRAVFGAISFGTLSNEAFHVGSSAHDGSDRIIYNAGTGQLFYDADGNGGGAAILFATLNTGLPLSASDFVVI